MFYLKLIKTPWKWHTTEKTTTIALIITFSNQVWNNLHVNKKQKSMEFQPLIKTIENDIYKIYGLTQWEVNKGAS